MMKRYFLAIVMLVIGLTMSAMPAKKGIVKNVILDNKLVTVSLCGDEAGHWWETADGDIVQFTDDDSFKMLSKEEIESMRQHIAAKSMKRSLARKSRLMKARRADGKSNLTASKKGLVILVEFQNLSMKSTSTRDEFDNMFNQEGYSNNNHIGSVHDYFYDQSYGQFDLTFDVVGPVRVSKNYAYYGTNVGMDDQYPATMVAEACMLADELVNFADYDWDDDGEVEQVYVVYAGYGENAGAASNTIWPHEWTLSEAKEYKDGEGALTLDGVLIDTYAVSSELAGRTSSTMNGIGTACHEFSHCLGYPDFYDVNYYGLGMQSWDVLDSGSYNGPKMCGEVPAGYTAYERWVAGWLQPVELNDGDEISNMKPLNDEPEAYVVYNEANHNEYYLLENRNNTGWFSFVNDTRLSRSGLLITHVDYSQKAWNDNTVNATSSHQRMSFFAANNRAANNQPSSYYANQLYPTSTNNSLTNESTPAAKVFNTNVDGKKFMNKPITDITKNEDGTISFFCGDADAGTVVTDPDVIFYESFNKCNGTGGNDNLWSNNIATSTFNADNEGWTSVNKYGANRCARFGAGKTIGLVTSPAFSLKGSATLTFKAGLWGTDGNTLDVYLNDELLGQYELKEGEWTDFSFDMEGNGSCQIKLVPEKRFFLDEVMVKKTTTTIIANPYERYNDDAVYTITGQFVGRAMEALPSGLYIQNGRKIIVK